MKKVFTIFLISIFTLSVVFAGNPDRQGEAGAYELLMNPWARSAGFHTLNTSFITGVESMRLNVAGLSRIGNTEFNLGYSQYLKSTSISMNSIGFAQKLKKGVLGISVMNVNFGDIDVTTTVNPEGTGATFSPSFFNMGLAYAVMFENKISVGFTTRVVSESISNIRATAACFDAGVQYVSGAKDNLKLGISLRNVGTKMNFDGDGLTFKTPSPDPRESNTVTVKYNAQGFELPSVLNLGVSYDIIGGNNDEHVITTFANFTANSFSQDDLGGGIQYAFNDMIMLRGAYRYALGTLEDGLQQSAYTGLALGASLKMNLNKSKMEDEEVKKDVSLAVDYSYRATSPFGGTHNFGIVLSL